MNPTNGMPYQFNPQTQSAPTLQCLSPTPQACAPKPVFGYVQKPYAPGTRPGP